MKAPRTVEQATDMLARYAELDAQRVGIEHNRNDQLAQINAAADATLTPVVAELQEIEALVAPWFAKAGKALLPSGRKSMELGGCKLGLRKGRASVQIAGDEADVVAILQGLRWAKPLLRVKTSLNKSAVLTFLDTPRRVALAELGISSEEGEDTFYIERVEQSGTIGSGA